MVARKSGRSAPAQNNAGLTLYGPSGGRKYVNLAERRRVLAAIVTLPADKALFALTLAWTGGRVSEVLSLTADSFQLECGTVAIITLKRRRYVVREVPLPPALIAALEEHFRLSERQRDPAAAMARLWPWCRVTAWRLIKAAMREAQIVGKSGCPRGLRHGFGVGALQAGVPLNLVQRWLGHARISTTAIYADACGPEEQAIAANFWRLAA